VRERTFTDQEREAVMAYLVDLADLAVDGADELDADLILTKGGGGALLREKVVATLSDRFVVIATEDKVVERLGVTFPLPIEVVPFAVGPVSRTLRAMGADPLPRDEGRYRTDNGNVILDTRFPDGIEDPAVTDVTVTLIPGVVEVGLFIDLADVALLGGADGTITRRSAWGTDDRDGAPG
jgi:ribose 5-phosphate isomerase A